MNVKELVVLNAEIGNPKTWKPFEFKYDGSTIDQTIERLDGILTDSMYRIKDKHPDSVYGLGLSGGLDSRVVLHYAKKVGMDVNCFLFGKPHPHYPFASRDYKNALLIGKQYGIPKHTIELFPPYDMQLFVNFLEDCFARPDKAIVPMDIIGGKVSRCVDILLTGHTGGESMGSCIPATPPIDVTRYIFARLSNIAPINDGKVHTPIEGILSDKEYNAIYDKLDRVLYRYDDYVSAIYTYLYSHLFIHHHGSPGMLKKNGLPAFSPFYTKEYIAEMKTWNPDWITQHLIQKEFHKRIVPNLCGITNQRWMVPFKYQDTWLNVPYSYLLRGAFLVRWHSLTYHTQLYNLLHSTVPTYLLTLKQEDFPFDPIAVLMLPKKFSVLGCNILKVKLQQERPQIII